MERKSRSFQVLWALCVLFLSLFEGRAFSEERIVSFSVTGEVTEEGGLNLREEITLHAEGKEIRRGIIRVFPTDYTDESGKTWRTEFSLREATLDGEPTPWEITRVGGNLEIRLGDPDRFLSTGQHTFVLDYATSGWLGFFEKHDELYWNVTGDAWSFPIDEAAFSLQLPGKRPGEGFESIEWYTGRRGEKGNDARRLPDGSVVSTRTLAPGEGLTVVYTWPKGIVSPPLKGAEELQRWSVSPYRTLHLAMPVVLLGISLLFWFLWGRDPRPGTIIPRFSPPQGIEAGFARYVRTMAVDDHCFAAMVLGLAVKGALTIEEHSPLSSSIASENALAGKALSLLSRVMGKQYRLRIRSDRIANLSLTAEEQLLLTFLFVSGKGELLLSGDNRLVIQETFTQLKKRFVERAKPLFSANLGKWALSVALFEIYAVGLFILMIVDASKGSIARMEPLVAMLAGPFFLLPLSLPIPPGKGNWGTRFFLRILFPGIFLFVLLGATFAGGASGLAADPVSAPAPLLCAAILLLFKPLMKVRSDSGARLAEELEGLRLYMATAETPRMEQMTPPQETPELFEALLPYAFALDTAKTWANRFEKTLAAARYSPSWYRGDACTFATAEGIASFSSGFVGAVASGTRSSGSDGSGSSGGGGGGGGGRGW